MDSILVNGKGSVQCLSQEKLQNLVAARLGGLMKAFNAQLSDKGFVADFECIRRESLSDCLQMCTFIKQVSGPRRIP